MDEMKKIEEQRKRNKAVRDRNYRFRKMTPQRQRVTIAKDVLELLEGEEIQAKNGVYMYLGQLTNSPWKFSMYGDVPTSDAGKVKLHELIESAPECQVCGIGSCFVAAIRRADGASAADMKHGPSDDAFMRKYLRQWFSTKQLQLIECAFEKSYSFASNQYGVSTGRAVLFGMNFERPNDRLRAIMQNIVDNDGEFNP